MLEARLQISLAIRAVDHRVDHLDRRRPLRALGLLRRGCERRLLRQHELRECDRLAIGRPGDRVRRLDQIGKQRGLSGVDPAHVQLRAAFGGRDVREARAIRRPARRHEVPGFGAQRTVVSAVGVHHPQIAARAIGHDVVADAHVDDAAAVRGDLHIVGVLELEYIDGVQALGLRQVGGSGSGAHTKQQGRTGHGERAKLHGESCVGKCAYFNRGIASLTKH